MDDTLDDAAVDNEEIAGEGETAHEEVAVTAPPPSISAPDAAEAILEAIIEAKGGSRRDGQVLMARNVAMALSTSRPLLVQGGTGIGKALDVDTLIPTPDRGFVRMGDLRVGWKVFNEMGQIVRITEAFDVLRDRPCYEITFSDGTTIVADADHLWDTLDRAARRLGQGVDWSLAKTVTTKQIASSLMRAGRANHVIPLAAALDTPTATDLPVTPYALGVWLGGTVRASETAMVVPGSVSSHIPGLRQDDEGQQVRLTPTEETFGHLRDLGVTDGDAHIPDRYLFASKEQREALMQGLLDASGYVVGGKGHVGGQVQFTDARERLAADVQSLVASLGFRPSLRPRHDKDGKVITWIVAFSPARPVFGNQSKNDRLGTPASRRTDSRSIVSVKKVPSRPVRCISVEGERNLYLAGRAMIPTHNSIGYLSGILASGKQVVVAPHTKALQDQLRGDLDLIASAFPADGGELLDGPPRYAVIKGRKSYLCLSKVRGDEQGKEETLEGLEEDFAPTSDLGKEFVALSKWADQTDTGDRSDVPFPVSSKAWNLASVSSEECTGKACPFYKDKSCFAEKARRRGQYANVVVVNQNYLAMGMKIERLLPEGVEGVVLDEAHEFPAVVADTFGAQVGTDRLRNALKKTTKPLTEFDEARAEPILTGAEKQIKRLDVVMTAPKNPDRDLITNPKVVKVLTDLRASFSNASDLASLLPEGDEQEKSRKDLLARMLDNLIADLDLLLMGSTDTQVAWVETQRGKAIARSARFDVAQTINDLLVRRYKGVVFTSATLTVAGQFDQTARQFGMEHAQQDALDEGRVQPGASIWGKSIVPSPFDYSNSTMLYMPTDMPEPSTAQGKGQVYYEAVAKVAEKAIRAGGGRTLVLCTSRESVRVISEHLQMSLGDEYPIYAQEPGEPAKEVARKFAEDPRSVLVGTRTFWTGVSVEGDTCATVILDKLPFPSPGEPITSARSEKADKRGKGLGFREVFLAEACLTAVQGAGRLVRTVRDRGVVIICDPRLNPRSRFKKSYNTQVLNSLPPFRWVQDEDEVWRYLEQINATANDAEPHEVEIDETAEDEA